jgi:hypothetical protein
MNLTAQELDLIHSALLHKQRNLPDLIKAWGADSHRGKELQDQLDNIPALSRKICEALVDAKLKVFA